MQVHIKRVDTDIPLPRYETERMTMNRKLRMGMVGGGQGAFIGGVHRAAALMDGKNKCRSAAGQTP